jgi:hypothetical protein
MGQPAVRHKLTNTLHTRARQFSGHNAETPLHSGQEWEKSKATIDMHAFGLALGLFARDGEQELALYMLELLAGFKQLLHQLPLLDQQLLYLLLVLAVRLVLLVEMRGGHPQNLCSPVHVSKSVQSQHNISTSARAFHGKQGRRRDAGHTLLELVLLMPLRLHQRLHGAGESGHHAHVFLRPGLPDCSRRACEANSDKKECTKTRQAAPALLRQHTTSAGRARRGAEQGDASPGRHFKTRQRANGKG